MAIAIGSVLCSLNFAANEAAAELKLLPAAAPANAFQRVPDPEGLVAIVISSETGLSGGPVAITLNPFWGTDGTRYDFRLRGGDVARDGKVMQIMPGQPVVLEARDIPDGQQVWGTLTAEINGSTSTLPLVLGNFGVSVENSESIEIPASRMGHLTVDISQHRAFGNKATFSFTDFYADGHHASVGFRGALESDLSKTLTVVFAEGQNKVDLPIDASSLLIEKSYKGALQTAIGNRKFIDTPLTLRRKNWGKASFESIPSAQGEGPMTLILSPATDQPIVGVMVSSEQPSTADFNPRKDLGVLLQNGPNSISLWALDPGDGKQVSMRTLQPGGRYQVTVQPATDLPAGQYKTTLRFGALNADPEWANAEVTLIIRNNPVWAVLVLVVAVLFSYATSKGIGTALRRRNLRLRIAAIRRVSWLRRDRWGALAVVRAFARVARADQALTQNYGFKWLFRMVTVPELIANEVTEVEKRLKVLERLGRLSIYWKASPLANGLQVSGVDRMVVRRAQKILRRISDRLSQLVEGEEIGTDIIGEIEALESWTNRENMEAGYWASLRVDIQFLLDAVQTAEFEFDEKSLDVLVNELNGALNKARQGKVKQSLNLALEACRAAKETGTQAIRNALLPVSEDLQDADMIEKPLQAIEASEREVVRRLQLALQLTETPGTLNAMIQLEEFYAILKLIWEQRGVDEWRMQLVEFARKGSPVKQAFKWIDDEVWKLLKVPGTVRIVPPNEGRTLEEYEPIDFRVVCKNSDADTYLFNHGLEYSWEICVDGTGQPMTLAPISCSTTVTQFIPRPASVDVKVTMRYRDDECIISGTKFATVGSTQFKNLWPVPTTELIGIGLAFGLALVAGIQSDAFANALLGSWRQYIELFAWGIAADQTRNLLQNLDGFTKGKDAPVT